MPRWKGIDIHDLQRTVFNRPLVALWNMAGHRSFVRHTDRCKQSIPREIEQRYRRDIRYLLVPAASKDYVSLPDIYMVVGVTMACHSRNYVSGMQRAQHVSKKNFRHPELFHAQKLTDLFERVDADRMTFCDHSSSVYFVADII